MNPKNLGQTKALRPKTLYSEDFNTTDIEASNMQEFIDDEEGLFRVVRFFQEESLFTNKTQETKEFQEALDIQKMELQKDPLPLPIYLQNYMNMSFQSKPESRPASLVVKIAQDGLRFLGGIFDQAALVLEPASALPVRAKEKSFNDVLNLKETNQNDQIFYQVIRENDEEAYLCINFPNKQDIPYHQVNLKKNSRFIFSSQVGESGAVSFSGLKEGKYNVEFIGKKNTKSIDLTILVDHP
jgi:hypothetical protein